MFVLIFFKKHKKKILSIAALTVVAALHCCIVTGWRCACAVDERLQQLNWLSRGHSTKAVTLLANGVDLFRKIARDITERLTALLKKKIKTNVIASYLSLDYSSQLNGLEKRCNDLKLEYQRIMQAI